MSDSKLRELERRWRETGSVDDEATYLRERLRQGDLNAAHLELAAQCGYPAAQRLLGRVDPVSLESLCSRLASFCPSVMAVACLAMEAVAGPAYLANQPADERTLHESAHRNIRTLLDAGDTEGLRRKLSSVYGPQPVRGALQWALGYADSEHLSNVVRRAVALRVAAPPARQ